MSIKKDSMPMSLFSLFIARYAWKNKICNRLLKITLEKLHGTFFVKHLRQPICFQTLHSQVFPRQLYTMPQLYQFHSFEIDYAIGKHFLLNFSCSLLHVKEYDFLCDFLLLQYEWQYCYPFL